MGVGNLHREHFHMSEAKHPHSLQNISRGLMLAAHVKHGSLISVDVVKKTQLSSCSSSSKPPPLFLKHAVVVASTPVFEPLCLTIHLEVRCLRQMKTRLPPHAVFHPGLMAQ